VFNVPEQPEGFRVAIDGLENRFGQHQVSIISDDFSR
jgi:hypothetical protein